MAPPSVISRFPPELFGAILDHVALADLQATTYSLSLVFHFPGFYDRYLYPRIVLYQSKQVVDLWRRLRHEVVPEGSASLKSRVREFKYAGWKVDADMLNSLLEYLPRITLLELNVGTTFAPEHLEEMFQRPRSNLTKLMLRFRPYFEKATYYQFMAGAYYDTMLNQLAKWPKGSLETLSIVQDPIPRVIGNSSMAFAQPIVFFSLQPITTLAISPFAKTVTSLRFRVPARTVWPQLCFPLAFPRLEFLDLSTSFVNSDEAVTTILRTFPRLRHLVIDSSGICGSGLDRDGWKGLGRKMAMAGINKARDTDRQIRSLRGTEPCRVKVMGKHGHDADAHLASTSKLSKEDTTDDASDSDENRSLASSSTKTVMTLVTAGFRILAPPPRLRTLSASSFPRSELQSTEEEQERWILEFESGWYEGIQRLQGHWHQTRAFAANTGKTLLRIDLDAKPTTNPTAGLIYDDGSSDTLPSGWDDPPVLCFGCETDPTQLAIRERSVLSLHRDGCGHRVGLGA